jgi:alpha-beta hydrolase superfamily lysophospholipase
MDLTVDHRLAIGPEPDDVRAVALMLHGGAERGPDPIDERSLAFRRTRWMTTVISGRLARAGVRSAMLRFRVKGWNADRVAVPSPVADARDALAHLRAQLPDLPIVLVGHSMGARTAAWVADEPGVVGVVGLAPWLPPDDPVDALAGKHLVAAHGRRDRITSARATDAYVRRAERVAASARFLDMGPLGHYMVAGVRRWNATAVSATLSIVDAAAEVPSRE